VLLGAQQFRSKVDSEILGNCGTSFYGRVGDEEIINSAYRSISETARQELLGLPKGRMLVRHAHFRAPLFGTFPLPPTIQGTSGQRIFNGASKPYDPCNGLFRSLKKVLGNGAPSLSDVKVEAHGVSAERIEEVRVQFDRTYSADRSLPIGSQPWKWTQRALRTAAETSSLS
jgi:hypothetical protein